MGSHEVLTSCTCDCPDTCSIIAHTQDGNVVSLRGNPEFPPTRGFLCRKHRLFLKRLFSSQRILKPIRKDGATWREVTWSQAIDLVVDSIERTINEYGPLSILYFQDAGSIAVLKIVNQRFFNLLGGVTLTSGSLCGGAGIAGQTSDFGHRTSHDPFDLLNSRVILIWGRNPVWTNVHLVPILLEAKRRGTRLVLIDPIETATAKIVDIHLKPRPGTDSLLALLMGRVIIRKGLVDDLFIERYTIGYQDFVRLVSDIDYQEAISRVGLRQAEIEDVALLYATHKPSAILTGWGLQRRRNGANIYRFIDALAALTGNIGIVGGGVSHGMDETRWFDKSITLSDRVDNTRFIPKPQVGRGILTANQPPIKAIFVTGANPVNQCPNTELVKKAFRSVEFVVVFDMFLTDTALLADVVLPTTHFLQESDLVASYWHNYILPVNPAQKRIGEEKTDIEIFHMLASRLGFARDFPQNHDFYLRQMIKPLVKFGVTLETLRQSPYRPPSAIDVPFSDRKFTTPSGKFEFVREILQSDRQDPDYPYYLLSPHPRESIHSQIEPASRRMKPVVHVSPSACKGIGARDGDVVIVETPYGSLECVLRQGNSLRDDVAVIYEGSWDTLGGSVNRLTSDHLSDDGLCATYNDVRCRIRRR